MEMEMEMRATHDIVAILATGHLALGFARFVLLMGRSAVACVAAGERRRESENRERKDKQENVGKHRCLRKGAHIEKSFARCPIMRAVGEKNKAGKELVDTGNDVSSRNLETGGPTLYSTSILFAI